MKKLLENKIYNYPTRIVCLTEETTEFLYILGQQDRIVGVSGFTVRPKIARKEKPTVCTFIEANIEKIIDLEPDLVIGFSDLQADIAKQLIEKGISVFISNHRTVEGIMGAMRQLGAMVNKVKETDMFLSKVQKRICVIQEDIKQYKYRPKVYFEEWYDPIIVAIRWVSDIIELAGGEHIYKSLSEENLAKDRILKHSDEVVNQDPDIILISWCGKAFKKQTLINRSNWDEIEAVKQNQIFEIPSSVILQPGPASITEGLELIREIIVNWHKLQGQ